MKTMSARDANQSFSKLLAEVENGETVLITKNGRTVAELRPRSDDPGDDPVWRAAFDRMVELMRQTPATGSARSPRTTSTVTRPDARARHR